MHPVNSNDDDFFSISFVHAVNYFLAKKWMQQSIAVKNNFDHQKLVFTFAQKQNFFV